jgi:glutamyl/glutaminyl-tRNA synthetase
VLSKRKLIQLVEEKHVDGWDDPRLPTLVGARRRGFTPEGFRRFNEMIGVTKSDSWIDIGVLEECQREHLNETAPRRIAVLDPLKLVIDNYPEGQEEECLAPNHPQKPEWGKRPVPFSRSYGSSARTSWKCPPRATSASSPATRCGCATASSSSALGCDKDAAGNITAVHCDYMPDSKSGTPGSDSYKVKGNIHWVSARHAYAAEVRLYDRLFAVPRRRAKAARFHRRPQPGFEAGHHRATRTGVEGCGRRGPLPVRTPRLFRRRPHRLQTRRAGVQSHRDAEGFVGEGKIRERRTRSGFDASSHQEASKCANLPMLSLPPAQASRPTPTP